MRILLLLRSEEYDQTDNVEVCPEAMDSSDAEECGEKQDGTCVFDASPDAATVKTNPIAVSSAFDVQKCVCEGCSLNVEEPKTFQPQEAAVLSKFERCGRKFRSVWYGQHKWLTLCVKQRKVFCAYCRYAHSHKLTTFANRGDAAFVSAGFDNFKKDLGNSQHTRHQPVTEKL